MMKLIPIYLRVIGIVFISFFFVLHAYPQEEEDIRELYLEAESYFLYEEFADALPLYQRILKTDPEEVRTLHIRADVFSGLLPFVVEAECRWVKERGTENTYLVAGFEITRISDVHLKELRKLVKTVGLE